MAWTIGRYTEVTTCSLILPTFLYVDSFLNNMTLTWGLICVGVICDCGEEGYVNFLRLGYSMMGKSRHLLSVAWLLF